MNSYFCVGLLIFLWRDRIEPSLPIKFKEYKLLETVGLRLIIQSSKGSKCLSFPSGKSKN